MSPSIDREPSLPGRTRRRWQGPVMQSLAMVMMLLMATVHLGPGPTQAPSGAKHRAAAPMVAAPMVVAPVAEQHQGVTSRLPSDPSEPANGPLQRRWMTEAVMTSHTLTAAHFFDRNQIEKLSAGPQDLASHG